MILLDHYLFLSIYIYNVSVDNDHEVSKHQKLEKITY